MPIQYLWDILGRLLVAQAGCSAYAPEIRWKSWLPKSSSDIHTYTISHIYFHITYHTHTRVHATYTEYLQHLSLPFTLSKSDYIIPTWSFKNTQLLLLKLFLLYICIFKDNYSIICLAQYKVKKKLNFEVQLCPTSQVFLLIGHDSRQVI